MSRPRLPPLPFTRAAQFSVSIPISVVGSPAAWRTGAVEGVVDAPALRRHADEHILDRGLVVARVDTVRSAAASQTKARGLPHARVGRAASGRADSWEARARACVAVRWWLVLVAGARAWRESESAEAVAQLARSGGAKRNVFWMRRAGRPWWQHAAMRRGGVRAGAISQLHGLRYRK